MVVRAGLSLVSVPFRLMVWARKALYGIGILQRHQAGCPVISVGNLTAGGTGKTPMVELLARKLLGLGHNPVILSRGYGAKALSGAPDEAAVMSDNLPEVAHVILPDRVEGAQEAISAHKADVCILDDGFQHIRLKRDLDIVLLDASNPFGFNRMLPRGLLREPLSALRRADLICITQCHLVPTSVVAALCKQVEGIAPGLLIVQASLKPVSIVDVATGEVNDADMLKGKKVVGFCGIGNPASFKGTLEQAGADVIELTPFPDHHAYTPEDIQALATSGSSKSADFLVCTQKDAVKIAPDGNWGLNLFAVHSKMVIRSGENIINDAITRVMEK